ncbi:MAG: hypothetical protein GY861_02975 [bacterium]|nr:hypothetical protein [bacterium]
MKCNGCEEKVKLINSMKIHLDNLMQSYETERSFVSVLMNYIGKLLKELKKLGVE